MAGSMPMRDKASEEHMHMPHRNTSQFFITTKERNHAQGGCTILHYNERHVIFGRVVEGIQSVQAINRLPNDPTMFHALLDEAIIAECGQLKSKQEEAEEAEAAKLAPSPQRPREEPAVAPCERATLQQHLGHGRRARRQRLLAGQHRLARDRHRQHLASTLLLEVQRGRRAVPPEPDEAERHEPASGGWRGRRESREGDHLHVARWMVAAVRAVLARVRWFAKICAGHARFCGLGPKYNSNSTTSKYRPLRGPSLLSLSLRSSGRLESYASALTSSVSIGFASAASAGLGSSYLAMSASSVLASCA